MEHPPAITIDAPTTKDMDDAICVRRVGNHWFVDIYITDVAATVKPGTDHDLRAFERVVSRYLPHKTVGMLPWKLSEESLSLWPNKPRAALRIEMSIDLNSPMVTGGNCTLSFVPDFKSAAKISYEDVPGILKDPKSPWHTMLTDASQLAVGLLTHRRSQGALALYDLNNGWVTTEEGHLKQLTKKEETIGYIIIQELMVASNAAVAFCCVDLDIPILYRNHQAKMASPDRQDLISQLNDAIHTPMSDLAMVRQRTHMLLDRAHYGSTAIGHYGLNLPFYTHVTSPIRRYPDLINLRQIKGKLDGGGCPYTQERLAEMCTHINNVIEEQRQAKVDHLKTKANMKAQRRLEMGSLRRLADRDLERVIKVAIREIGGRLPEALDDEIRHRIKEGRLPILHQFLVMSKRGWDELSKFVALSVTPSSAVSILTIAAQMGWPAVTYKESYSPAQFVCEASWPVYGGPEVYSVSATAQNKKTAKQLAARKLLTDTFAGGLDPDHPEVRKWYLDEPVSTGPSLVATDRDPVSVLHEWCQQNGENPTYNFTRTGADHTPTFICRCECFGVAREGKASSKKEAKRQSVLAVLGALTELPDDHHVRTGTVPDQS